MSIEKLERQIEEITNALKGLEGLDKERMIADLENKVQELVDARVSEAMDKIPQFPPAGGAPALGVSSDNRYARLVRDIAHEGKAMIGPTEIGAADMALAYDFLRRAAMIAPDQAKPPSEELAEAVKAMSTSNAADIVNEVISARMWEDIMMAARVASTLQRTPMPSSPFHVPTSLNDPVWRKGAQNQATTGTDLTPGRVTLTATELVAMVSWSYTLDEDAVIQLMPSVRGGLSRSGADIVDAFIVNADSSTSGNINLSDGTPAADAYYLSDGQDGLRHLPLVDNTAMKVDAGGDALMDADIVSALALLDKYGANPNDLVIVTNVRTYVQGFLATGAGKPGDYVMTMDKIGRDALVLTGQVGAYRGIPIVLSSEVPLTSADGTVTNAGPNDKGQVLIYNRTRWMLGFRRDLLIEVERDIKARQFIMVASIRPAVAAYGNRASATHTAAIINIAV